MMQRRTNVFILLTTLLLTFCLLSIANSESDAKKGEESKDRTIVARVNGQPIYKEALVPLTEQEMKKFRKYGMGRKPSPEMVKHLEERALEQVITQELLTAASRNIKIEDIEKKVDEGIENIKIKYRGEEGFKNYLHAKKLTENDLRENVKKGIYMEKYLEEKGVQNPEIPEEEIKAFYEESKANYWNNETIRASHILIKVDQYASQEEKDAARQKAEKIRTEIVNGKLFAAAAREFSEDANAPNGGNLNYITRGFMPPEFDSVAFAMNKDEVSEVVQTKFGFHIIKVYDRKPAGYSSYDEMRDFIKKYLQKEVSRKKLAALTEELKTKAKIEMLLN